MNATTDGPAAPAAAPPPATTPPACRNCGAPLLGPHCYACGQPVKGLVRPLGNLFGDLLDSVFNIDTRILRTLPPLFARPGFLTAEYFAGRQVRYVTPVRLFFFLAIITFFVAQFAIDGPNINLGKDEGAIATATTAAEVERLRDAQLKDLAEAKQAMAGTPAAPGIAGIEAGEAAVREEAAARLRQLRDAGAKGEPPPPATAGDGFDVNLKGRQWDPDTNPIAIDWLPAFANAWLNGQLGRAKANIARLRQDPGAFKDAVLAAVPTTLFVLVPLFALMLKLAYTFKRRLYMEHVVVALHSHAFLCLDLLLVLVAGKLEVWLAPQPGALQTVFNAVEAMLVAWMPVHLLLMQKRVYAQGWPMTLLKSFVLGTCYSILLSFAIIASLGIGLVAM